MYKKRKQKLKINVHENLIFMFRCSVIDQLDQQLSYASKYIDGCCQDRIDAFVAVGKLIHLIDAVHRINQHVFFSLRGVQFIDFVNVVIPHDEKNLGAFAQCC